MITQELVKQLFDYKNGFLYWKITHNQVKIGDKAGTLHHLKGGDRLVTGINNKTYLNSRLIFLYHKGFLPKEVDHIDRNKLNDKINNLRAASRIQNMKNKSSQKNSSSKYVGVSFHKKTKKWYAQIRIDGRLKFLGGFKIEDEAAAAYNKAAEIHHGEFANLNKLNC